LSLGALDPESVRVELYADASGGWAAERHAAVRVHALEDDAGTHLYRVDVPAGRPSHHYTARALPWRHDVAIPLEARQILWQR
jgi:starch phosphorylase